MAKQDNGSSTRCYHTHPPLPVGNGKVIYGGNGEHPVLEDADVYVALDYPPNDTKFYPWHGKSILIHFKMTDGQPPKDTTEFKNLIGWLSDQLDAGKKVHVGCIGGHGRTGTVFTALVAHRKASDDPIAYVRDHYCKRVVETMAQVNYLVEEWGCKSHPGSYTLFPRSTGGQSGKWSEIQGSLWQGDDYAKSYASHPGHKKNPIYSSETGSVSSKVIDSGTPFRDALCIWSSRVKSSVGAAAK